MQAEIGIDSPTLSTELAGRKPTVDMVDATTMNCCHIVQLLQEGVEREVRYFTTPQPFHTIEFVFEGLAHLRNLSAARYIA
jgi:hypothetical protein